MDLIKEKTVKEIYAKLLKVGFGDGAIQEMPQFIAEDVMGYGTALDEKILSIEEFKELIHDQRKQSKDFDEFRYTSSPVIIRLAENGQSAVIVDEIELVTVIDGKSNLLPLRMSTVMELIDGTWKIIHWHGSLAEHVSDGEDPWHVTQWKQETEKLQRMVDEKTADLETKNRELEIEASLERVRAVAMGMQKPDDLLDVCQIISEQLVTLKVKNIRNVQVAIIDESKKNYLNYQFFTPYSKKVFEVTEYENHPASQAMVEEMQKSANSFFTGKMDGVALDGFRKWRKEYDQFPDPLLDNSDAVYYYFYSIGKGGLGLTTYEEISESDHEIFKRFHKVFTLAYQRYEDIRKALAQAREAQIEAALEKVRNVALSLQKSDEMLQVAQVLYEQLLELGFVNIRNALIDIKNGNTDTFTDYDYSHEMSGTITQMSYHDDPTLEGQFKMMANTTDDFFELILEGKELEDLKKMRIKNGEAPDPRLDKIDLLTYNLYSFGNGAIGISNFGVLTDQEKSVLSRFSNVFTFAYKRYSDMVQAEQQAREALVELSLERIRAQVTAMQESSELLDIVVTMQTEFNKLGHEAHYFWHMRWLPDKYEKALTNAEGDRIGNVLEQPRGFHGLKNMMDWEKSNEPSAVFALEPDIAADYIDKMIRLGRFQEIDHTAPGPDEVRDMGGLTFVMARTTHGEIGYTLPGVVPHPPEEDIAILVRFAGVFDLAYRRFEDLKSAEARTKEALKQATLDRVRGQVASMRKPEDLQQVTPLIWNELKTLDVPFFRCGVFIVDEKKKHVQVFLTTPEGKSLAALDLDFDQSDLTRNAVASWRNKKVYQEHWNKDEFIAWAKEMMKLRQIEKPETYQGDEEPPASLHLHFIPFAQGMLYVGHIEQLEQEKIDLVKSLAEAFSFAYARYEDFVVLEEAKERVEKALGDLRATQSQLVHAEKMASLGELTAGIAHEIQNPLNFVNNFSEVSTELVDELKQELAVGSWQLAAEIADDVKLNLDKISHHGRRASSIVKGMLEHSRAGSGEKVPTDINALADEYLRLAYHGFRARDNSFNADYRLEADDSLPKINVVPQDIGRVLLNLINNAFYAVSEKAKQNIPAYKPQVVIRTRNLDKRIEILVEDKGNGIPESLKDKIFQPFFTTKPTGEGTGLGLSLSYDIITKGHGGKIDVESEPGKGTGFIIILPTNQANTEL